MISGRLTSGPGGRMETEGATIVSGMAELFFSHSMPFPCFVPISLPGGAARPSGPRPRHGNGRHKRTGHVGEANAADLLRPPPVPAGGDPARRSDAAGALLSRTNTRPRPL